MAFRHVGPLDIVYESTHPSASSMRPLLAFLAACALLLAPCPARAQGAAAVDVLRRQVDSLFSARARSDAPGLAVAVVQDGRLVLARGYGMADLEHRIPITPSTVFDVASLSKQFAGLAIAMLVDEGRSPARRRRAPLHPRDGRLRAPDHHPAPAAPHQWIAGLARDARRRGVAVRRRHLVRPDPDDGLQPAHAQLRAGGRIHVLQHGLQPAGRGGETRQRAVVPVVDRPAFLPTAGDVADRLSRRPHARDSRSCERLPAERRWQLAAGDQQPHRAGFKLDDEYRGGPGAVGDQLRLHARRGAPRIRAGPHAGRAQRRVDDSVRLRHLARHLPRRQRR